MASKLKRLQERLAAIVAAMRQIDDVACQEERPLNEDEQKKYDALKTEHVDVKTDLDREIELQELERGLQPVPNQNEATDLEQAGQNGDRVGQSGSQGFASLGEQLQAVVRAADPSEPRDPRLVPGAITGLGESVASQGGFLVQTDFVAELLTRTYNNTLLINGGPGYSGVRKIPISANANSVKINAVNETSRADGSRWGGVQAYWIEEGGSKTASLPDFRQIELSLKKLIGLCYATDELLADAAALEAVISQAFVDEFAFKIQDALINGTGAGQPLGILNSPCLVNQAKETGQAAATIVKENIDKMWSRLDGRSIPRSAWLINQQCYPQLFGLQQSVGTGGMPVYLPPGGLSQSPYGTLMGRPVLPIEQCQALGTKGDIYFVDMSEYLFADKGGVNTASSIHLKFNYDETVFRFVLRADGCPAWNSAITPFKGGATATTSPFVTLAVRA